MPEKRHQGERDGGQDKDGNAKAPAKDLFAVMMRNKVLGRVPVNVSLLHWRDIIHVWLNVR